MPQNQTVNRAISKRLFPLYISAFFQSFVLWYTVEKLFMRSIGFDNATIGLMIAIYSAVMLAVETPAGILADRWSRKGVLILASICLSLSALIAGLSHSLEIYLISSVLWGIFFACYSGVYDSIIYDVVIEETQESSLFDKLYGRIQAIDSMALVLAGLIGGLIASSLGLRYTYYWSVPLALIPIIALFRFHEPTLHKFKVAQSIKEQVSTTFHAVLRKRSLLPIVSALIVRSTMLYILFEFSQLWLLQLNTPTQYYGVANAILLTSIGLGGIAASRLTLSRFKRMSVLLLIMICGLTGLIAARNLAVVVAAQLITATCLVAIVVIFNRMLHDRLEASVRAGASSATSTTSRILIIPLALLFGYVSNEFSIYSAAYILLGLGVFLVLIVLRVARKNNYTGLEVVSKSNLVEFEPR